MKLEKGTNEIDLMLETVKVDAKVRKLRLTRRNTFYRGLWGKAKCLWYWASYNRRVGRISLSEWLDQPVAYTIEFPDTHHVHQDALDKDILNELEHYLIDEIGKGKQ